MKLNLIVIGLFLGFSLSAAKKEDCVEEGEICAEETEYNKYLDCLKEYKSRSKRSVQTCPFADKTSCEYVDCNECSGCNQGGCSNDCRRCCIESCDSQLCCHKTCNNQCKTNYCRSSCRRDCKDRILSHDASGNVNVQGGNTLNSRTDSRTMNKHNITTIINLHNIINNTNQIDIPIKINNTNYNNITLSSSDQQELAWNGGGVQVTGGAGGQGVQIDKNGNRCCQVVGPRVCQKVEYFPYMRCFHYRKHRCGPFCNAPIVHAQPQQVCEENACHSRMIYIPQPQPRCFNVPYWPYVNCGGSTNMANCHGCYKHYTHKSHIPHGGCSRCYDDGYGMGSMYRQGPFYRPGYAHTPSCLQTGMCGMGMMPYGGMGMGMMPYGGMGYGMGMGMGMGMDMGMGMMPGMGYGMGMGAEYYSGAMGGYPINTLGYPGQTYNDPYFGQNITVLQGDSIDGELNPMSSIDLNVSPGSRSSRYAAVIIDGPNEEAIEKNEVPQQDQPASEESQEDEAEQTAEEEKKEEAKKEETKKEEQKKEESKKDERKKDEKKDSKKEELIKPPKKVEVTTEKVAKNV